MFKNPFSFNGRIGRTEYILSIIILYALLMIIGNISEATNLDNILIIIYLIPANWFAFAQGAKRCHDRGNSGWFQLIPFYTLWLIFAESKAERNEYGSAPKYR